MIIALVMVTTLDGISNRDDIRLSDWTSSEDTEHLHRTIATFDALVMGYATFEALGSKRYPNVDHYALTNDASKWGERDGAVIMGGDPKAVVEQLTAKGVQRLMLFGGAHTNAQFLAAGVVDEIHLTIEPKLLGQGIHMSEGESLNANLRLLSHETLNQQGTLLLKYQVLN